MSPDYLAQLKRLRKEAPPIDRVYEALGSLPESSETIWAYFYPLSLERAYGFFGGDNEEVANQAAFDLVEHLIGGALPRYNLGVAKLSPFYDRVSQNFFINYMERDVLKEPPIFYGHTEDVDGEPKPFNEEYPYDGVEENFVYALMEREGAEEKLKELLADLFPAERAVLQLLVLGHTYEEIAAELGRSQTAIYNSVRKISTLIPGK